MIKQLHKPHSIQVELSYGCNLSCDFCSLKTTKPKEPRFMSLITASRISEQISKFGAIRIEFAMRGEPTLNPNHLTIFKIFRAKNPESQLMITTNGVKHTRETIKNLYKSGINVILMDCYGNTYDSRMELFSEFTPIDYHSGKFNPYYRHTPKTTHTLVLCKDISKTSGEAASKSLMNQGGNVDFNLAGKYGLKPIKEPLKKKCVNPFREMAIHYDGSIHLCCEDWGDLMPLFNIMDGDIEDYWYNNKVLNCARMLLLNRERGFAMCSKCDFSGGFRQGFLPVVPSIDEQTKDKLLKFVNAHVIGI